MARSAPAPSRWVLTDLGTLAGDEGTSVAYGINDQGQVVGTSTTSDGSYHAFLWENGRMRDIGRVAGPGGGSAAVAINDRGQVAGTSRRTGPWTGRAVLWEKGAVRDLGTLGGRWSYATAINDRGQVVGSSATKDGKRHGFLWEDGRMRDLGAFAPTAINSRGQVVGWLVRRRGPVGWPRSPGAVLWEEGTLTALRPSSKPSQASGIDEHGRIAGTLLGTRDCNRLALWAPARSASTAEGALRRGPCAGGNHDVESHASINARGQVAATGSGAAYVWENGRRYVLPTLPRAQRSIATAINDRGQIVGASGRAHHFDPDRAVLWTPRAR